MIEGVRFRLMQARRGFALLCQRALFFVCARIERRTISMVRVS